MDLPESVSSIPPKRLALIVGGGVAVGLAWRYISKRNAVASPANGTATVNPYDAMQGAGNLGAIAGGIDSGTNNPSTDRRDVVDAGITLPVAQWVITDESGNKFLTDGHTITPYPGVNLPVGSTVSPSVAATPAVTPVTPITNTTPVVPTIEAPQSPIVKVLDSILAKITAPPAPAPAPAPVAAPAAAPAPPAASTNAHVIRSGETLWTLVQKQYGLQGQALINKINEVAAANGLRWNSAHTVVTPFNVGQTITL